MSVTTTPRTARVPFLRSFLLTGALAFALLVGAGASVQPVGATRISIDSGSAGCGIIADRINSLIAEYGRVGRANPNDPQLDVILAQLRDAGRDWQTLGCYGSPVNAHLVNDTVRTTALTTGNLQAVALP